MSLKTHAWCALVALAAATGCKNDDPEIVAEPTSFTAQVFASNLTMPIGMSFDERGQAWVTQSGTGKNDAQASLVTTDGKAYPVLTGLSSAVNNGAVEGIGHLLYHNGTLYVLDGAAGKLYTLDVSAFKPGDTPYVASNLSAENIGTFVLAQKLTTPLNTNLYNLTLGPDDNLYITDSGANAIIKRDSKTRVLSVFAKLPGVNTTTDAVPTGIVYDGNNFLVSGLSGFPFTPGATKIYLVSPSGVVSEYQTGFTTLTDIALSANNKPIVVQYAQFSLTPPNIGFTPKTGQLVDTNKATLLAGLDRPTDIERVGSRTYYVLSSGDGTIQKLTY
ncbi:ScyD/ScyE family protein [Hymenobacter sp. HMF4947]|uniref:ScyD/ScyE family protein n=1 Tax=Hymenobacter ginkgonis TaxID=2682976 RepID=A0A7K1TDC5_9BACT|nr:ScyD/ScyE family protein [Hymenobacter ginkgonis]MVN76406.1 ScyD/ScyE family protein [Hymenobacter ginkgonis]